MTVPRTARSAFAQLCLLAVLGFAACAPVVAGGPDELATQADKLVRSAERLMFNGKKTEADAELGRALKLLEELKAAAPEHAKLSTIESKYAKVRKDLDRRLGKSAPSAAAPSPPPAPAPPSKPAASSGSRDYRLPMAQKALTSVTRDADGLLAAVEEIFSEDPATVAIPTPVEKMEAQAGLRIARVTDGAAKVEAQYGDVDGLDVSGLTAARATAAQAEARVAELAAARRAQDASAAASASAAAEAQAARSHSAAEDAELIARLHESTRERMDGIYGRNVVYATTLTVDDARAGLEKLERAETVLPELQPHLGRLAETYGTSSMDISNAFFEKMGRDAPSSVGRQLEELLQAATLISDSRVDTGESLAQHCETIAGAWAHALTDAQLERLQAMKEIAVVAAAIDPSSDRLKELVRSLAAQIDEHSERMTAAIDAATWPGHVSSFPGPGTTKALASSMLDWFRSDRSWGGAKENPPEILDVAVRGPWQVAERDVFGRVVRWRVPILVAVTTDKLRPRNIARVYELSIVALEGAPDRAPKEPPWDGTWVGDNYMMRLDRFGGHG